MQMLIIGRALIGLGVAGSLAAGLKAIIEYFPKDRLPLVNGFFIACGAAGAVTATSPAEILLQHMGWRTLFLLLAAATAATAMFVIAVTPRHATRGTDERSAFTELFAIYTDRFFWRLAPLSALCIGTSWALQGLWAAPWLTDVAALSRPAVVRDLFIMAVALCIAAAVIGIVADRLKQIGIGTELLLGCAATIFIGAEAALIAGLHVPSIAPWVIISATGAATVLSYAILGESISEAHRRQSQRRAQCAAHRQRVCHPNCHRRYSRSLAARRARSLSVKRIRDCVQLHRHFAGSRADLVHPAAWVWLRKPARFTQRRQLGAALTHLRDARAHRAP